MRPSPIPVGYQVPLYVELFYLDNMDKKKATVADIFLNKRIVLFSMIGANHPLDGAIHLQDILVSRDDIIAEGVDDVYCVLVNDVWTLNEWFNNNHYNDYHVKFLSDGNTHFTSEMGYLVDRSNLGYGKRSWRYAMIVDNGIIEKVFVEEGMCDNSEDDPYEVTKPSNILEYLRG